MIVVQKKKKKGDGGSDDGSSSDEEADPLRKKIKWNMEPHLSIMRKAVEAALTGKSTTKIADEYSIPARTLRRYVANEKRDADRPKLLKTVDLGLSGLAKQQRMKAAAAAAAAAAAGGKSSSGKSTPRKGGSTNSSHQGKGSKFTSKHLKTMTKNMKKHAMDKKKKQAQTTAAASTSAMKKASLSFALGFIFLSPPFFFLVLVFHCGSQSLVLLLSRQLTTWQLFVPETEHHHACEWLRDSSPNDDELSPPAAGHVRR